MKKLKNKILILFVFFCSGVYLHSCKAKKAVKTAVPDENCAFYAFKLSRDTILNKTRAEITNVNVVNSKVRYVVDEEKSRGPYFLKIEILYPGNKTIEAFTEHPLYKRVEIYSESGEITSKLISLSQGEVFLRVPSFGNYKRITISEIVDHKTFESIILKNDK